MARATKPRGGGAKGLRGRATMKRTLFAASLIYSTESLSMSRVVDITQKSLYFGRIPIG